MSVPMKDEGSPSQPFVTMFFRGQALQNARIARFSPREVDSESTTGGKVACGRGAFYYSL